MFHDFDIENKLFMLHTFIDIYLHDCMVSLLRNQFTLFGREKILNFWGHLQNTEK